jgi:hypothetical protein
MVASIPALGASCPDPAPPSSTGPIQPVRDQFSGEDHELEPVVAWRREILARKAGVAGWQVAAAVRVAVSKRFKRRCQGA